MGDSVTAKDLRDQLIKENPDWNVPERRVKKFLKRHINQQSDVSVDESTDSRPSARRFYKFISGMRSKVVPPSVSIPETLTEEVEQAPESAVEVAPEGVYSDDSEVKKEDCECVGCVMM